MQKHQVDGRNSVRDGQQAVELADPFAGRSPLALGDIVLALPLLGGHRQAGAGAMAVALVTAASRAGTDGESLKERGAEEPG